MSLQGTPTPPQKSHHPEQDLQDHVLCALLSTLAIQGSTKVQMPALEAIASLVAQRADLGAIFLPCLVAALQRVIASSGVPTQAEHC